MTDYIRLSRNNAPLLPIVTQEQMQNLAWRPGKGTLPLYSTLFFFFLQEMNSCYYSDTNSAVWVLLPHYQAILQYQLGALQFNSVLILFTWSGHLIPQGKGSVLQDCLPPAPTHISDANQIQAVSGASDPLATDERSPKLPTLGSTNLLEWLTKLREIVSY